MPPVVKIFIIVYFKGKFSKRQLFCCKILLLLSSICGMVILILEVSK